jgi:hypothetical protein
MSTAPARAWPRPPLTLAGPRGLSGALKIVTGIGNPRGEYSSGKLWPQQRCGLDGIAVWYRPWPDLTTAAFHPVNTSTAVDVGVPTGRQPAKGGWR